MPNRLKLSDALSRDELRSFQTKSNFKALVTLVWNWGLIIAAFALAIVWTNPLTIVIATLLLAGRQLGLGILTHDCAHHAFFENKKVNDIVGRWLCGVPVDVNLFDYREYHLKHHKYAGTDKDPDIVFVKNYPVTSDSIKRKFTRDITGRTGIRDLLIKLKHFKLVKSYHWVIFHLGLLLLLTMLNAPWAYLMWWVADLFILPALVRLRQIGEHGVAVDRTDKNPRVNTGTTIAPWWQRVLVAPNNVNYHVEHHYLASVPPYNLAKLHNVLTERGFYEGFDCVTHGYQNVIRRAIRSEDLVVS